MRNVKKGTDRTTEGKISCGYRGQAGADGGRTPDASGMEGKVTGVDDIGQIHVEWENGSTLALNVEEDDFTVVPQKETIAEKKCREFLGKVNEILKETDFYRLNVSCNGGDTAYAAEKLLAMHQAFETVYGEG